MGEAMALMLAAQGSPLGEATAHELSYAGAESNVAVGLARLGHRVAFVSRLGDDHLGRRVRRELRGEGIDVDAVTLDPARPTGLLVRDTVATGISVGYHRAGSAATALAPDDVPTDLLGRTRLLHLTGITAALSESARAACVHAAQRARAAGATVSLDPNVRLRLARPEQWRQIVEQLTPLTDILLIGADDAATIGVDDPIAWAHDLGVPTVVLKDGARGAIESSEGQRRHQPALTVPVVDPVGAGDAFAAGWLSGWLRGLPPEQRLREAAAVAACVVATRGDVPGLPDPGGRDRMLAGAQEVAR